MTTIDALSYTYLTVMTMFYIVLMWNFTWGNYAPAIIELGVDFTKRRHKERVEQEGCGTFLWDPYLDCYVGGNNDFLVFLGGGCLIPQNAPIPGAGEILISDLVDPGTKICILAHERGHKEVGSARHDSFLPFIWEEIKADHEAVKAVGREFYWQCMKKHALKLKKATKYENAWGDVLFWRNALTRAAFVLLWT